MSFNPFYAASFVLFNVKEVLLLHIENIKGKLFQNKLFQQMCGENNTNVNVITKLWYTNARENIFVFISLKY